MWHALQVVEVEVIWQDWQRVRDRGLGWGFSLRHWWHITGDMGSDCRRGMEGQSHMALAASFIRGSVGWSHQYWFRSCI